MHAGDVIHSPLAFRCTAISQYTGTAAYTHDHTGGRGTSFYMECSFSQITREGRVKSSYCLYQSEKKKNVLTALSDTQKCVAHTHFPSSRSHGQVSGVLKSPSCVYRWCIALICRIQAPQLRPRLQLLPRQVSLLVTPNVGLPWPSVSEGWRSPRHSGWPCKHVVKLGTADAQLSGVGTGIMKEGGGMRRKRAQAWFKDITESWETSTYQIYTRLSTILHTTVEKR